MFCVLNPHFQIQLVNWSTDVHDLFSDTLMYLEWIHMILFFYCFWLISLLSLPPYLTTHFYLIFSLSPLRWAGAQWQSRWAMKSLLLETHFLPPRLGHANRLNYAKTTVFCPISFSLIPYPLVLAWSNLRKQCAVLIVWLRGLKKSNFNWI